MPRKLDIDRWNRRDHYHFFREFEHPFFNVCADVDVTPLVTALEGVDGTFFTACLFLSLRAASSIEAFRMRMRGDEVVVHDELNAGSTVLNADDTFSFCYFEHHDRYSAFLKDARAELARNEREGGLDPKDQRDDLILFSVLPWISFTSFSHAHRTDAPSSLPRIVFGKYREREGLMAMPVSVEVHHALVDGLHVGRFFQGFQKELDGAGTVLGR